jgi:phage terminase large subunit
MYSREELALLKATLPEWKYRMFYEGLFERAEGLIFPIFDAARHIETPFTIPTGWNRYAGQDFGLKHPTASVFGTLDPRPYPNDVLHLYGEYRQSERSTPEHVKDIKAISAGFAPDGSVAKLKKMWADPRSVQLIEDYRAAGLPIEPAHAGPGSVKSTIQEVYTRLTENADDGLPRMRLFRGMLPGWIDEVGEYSWAKDAAGNSTDVPIEYADDEMDCSRYLCDGIKMPKSGYLPARRPTASIPITAGMRDRAF